MITGWQRARMRHARDRATLRKGVAIIMQIASAFPETDFLSPPTNSLYCKSCEMARPCHHDDEADIARRMGGVEHKWSCALVTHGGICNCGLYHLSKIKSNGNHDQSH